MGISLNIINHEPDCESNRFNEIPELTD